MDTRSKKSRPFLVWLCFFVGVNILFFFSMGAIVLWDDLSSTFNNIRAAARCDYKEYSRFKDAISNRFAEVVESVTIKAEAGDNSVGALQSADTEGINLIYYAKNLKTGKTVTNTSSDNFPVSEKGIDKLPEGYDYYVYFNGEKIVGKKGNEILDIYRNDSGYWNRLAYYLAGNASYVNHELEDIRVLLIVKEDIVENPYSHSNLFQMKKEIDYARLIIFAVIAVLLLSLVLIIISIIKRKRKQEFVEKLARLTGWFWFEIKVLLSILVWTVFVRTLFENSYYSYYNFPVKSIVPAIFLWWFYLIFIDLWFNKSKVFTNNSMNSIIMQYKKYENNKPLQKNMLQRLYMLTVAEVVLVFFIIIFTIAITAGRQTGFNIPLLIFVVIGIYLIYRYVRWYTKVVNDIGHLVDQIEVIKGGDMTAKHLINSGADLYSAQENLNLIQEGISRAVEEKTQSDRMKIELITNVSHDLKTPLTSIISYVDLLTKESDLPPHVVDYVNILSQKSERLKKLIQDLFDLSKAASGDIRLDMEKLDIGKLIQQTLADMDEQIVQSGLALKVNIPEEPIFILSDGSKLYRVFQNLFSNALKYSLLGSRIYVDLYVNEQEVSAIIKNTAAYEMNFGEEEILERFVRGDQARSTEGSGLGLAIAQNFTQACGGQFAVKVDGDLFKVIVSFKISKE